MKIAYISHSGRPCYEYPFLSTMDVEEMRFLDTNFSSYPSNPPKNVSYELVQSRTIPILSRIFHSTAKPIYYLDLDEHLQWIDVIMVLEVFSTLSQQVVKYAKRKGIRVVAYVYELIPNHLIYKIPLYKWNTVFVRKNIDGCITVSDFAKYHLIDLGFDSKKIETIYPWVDEELFHIDSTIERRKRSMIFVWKLEEHKWIDQIIEIFPEIIKRIPDIFLTVIGIGSLLPDILRLQKEYPNSIEVLGYIPNLELPRILCSREVGIFPSRDTYKFGKFRIGSEQFCFSVVEWMLSWIYPIVSNSGALSEIVQGVPSKVIRAWDNHSLLDAIISSISLNDSNPNQISKYASERYWLISQSKKLKKYLTNTIG